MLELPLTEFKGSTPDSRIRIRAPGSAVVSELGKTRMRTKWFERRRASILHSDLGVGFVTGNVSSGTVQCDKWEIQIKKELAGWFELKVTDFENIKLWSQLYAIPERPRRRSRLGDLHKRP
jgi:hypothetical protein